MAQALFVLVASPDLRPADLTNLAALAGVVRSAGHTPHLLIVDAIEDGGGITQCPEVFASQRRVAAPAGTGDGSTHLDRLVEAVTAETAATLIVAPSTIASRSWGARLAATREAEFLPACDDLDLRDGQLHATAPIMGGLARKTVALADRAAVVLYAGEDLAFSGGHQPAPESAEQLAIASVGVTLLRRDPLPDTGGIPLKGAAKVVSGGLGVGTAENWPKIEAFAARVGAAVGASRAAVEMGWVPSSRQVGFSGQKVAPDVYVAMGISGAVHHLAGINGARRIVAVNKDPEAPIFKVADLAIVGDCTAILEAANRRLDQV